MALVYLALGKNLGDKTQNLNDAITLLSMNIGNVIGVSSFYTSKASGFISENNFLNAVMLIETYLAPFQLLEETQKIEIELGRTKKRIKGYEDRLIDIDILLYDNLIMNQPTLKIPHPLMTERDFVLLPLVEIAPDLVHPISNLLISSYLNK